MAEASTRVPLALAGVGAAVVLVASWGSVRPPFDAGLALVIVVGAVHGVLGWALGLRLPARLGRVSFVAYGLVLLLFLLLTPERLGSDAASVLWTRLGSGLLLAGVVHHVLLSPASGPGAQRERAGAGPTSRPGWREVALLALLPGLVGAMVLVVNGAPDPESTGPRDAVELAVSGDVEEELAAALTFPTDGPTAVEPAGGAPPPSMADQATSTAADPGAEAAGAAPGGRPRVSAATTPTIAKPTPPTTVAPTRLNQLTAAVVGGLPVTAMVPYAERISNPDGTVPSSIRPDGVHLKQEVVPGIMDRGLEADLRAAYRQVGSRVGSAARAGHHWSRA